MTTILLIRHGQSEANLEKIFAGQVNPALTELGLEQAKRTAKYICEKYSVDKIYSSDLKRAYQTAQSLANMLDIEIIADRNLREIYAGKWEGLQFDVLKEKYKKEYEVWLNHIGKAVCTEGEAVKELGDRVVKAIETIAEENDGKTIAIAIHATPIRAMQTYIETGSFDDMEKISWVSNASVTELSYENKTWKIKALSQDEHLGELKTQLPANV